MSEDSSNGNIKLNSVERAYEYVKGGDLTGDRIYRASQILMAVSDGLIRNQMQACPLDALKHEPSEEVICLDGLLRSLARDMNHLASMAYVGEDIPEMIELLAKASETLDIVHEAYLGAQMAHYNENK